MIKELAKRILPDAAQRAIRGVLSWGRALRRSAYHRFVADKFLRHIKRGERERCWCGGELLPFRWHAGYGVCRECGTYVNRRPPLQSELERLYTLELYWHIKQRADGLPAIERRPAHDRRDGRVDYWLALIRKYGPPRGRVLEIGCAHGVLLKQLNELGYKSVGVEIDQGVADWTRLTMGVDVRAGFFPGIELPSCDLFLAFDVLEHSPNPQAFVCEAARLLAPGGVTILQTAIDRTEDSPPFGRKFKDAFDDIEHLFIFTDEAMRELARRARLHVVTLSERLWLMGEICILKKDA